MNVFAVKFSGSRWYAYILYALVISLALLAFIEYPGKWYVYVLFTILLNSLLYLGFRKNSLFFDTFIGILLWLGFWLKLTIRVVFFDNKFIESVGNFDGSGEAFDQALLVTSMGVFGLILASHIRRKYIFNYPKRIDKFSDINLFRFYSRYRKTILFCLLVLVLAVAGTNAYFGVYQRGSIPKTSLPYGAASIYKWLLLFGMASFIAVILKFEYLLNKKTTVMGTFLFLIEGFVSNFSLLSRGMLINAGALIYGIYKSIKVYSLTTSIRF